MGAHFAPEAPQTPEKFTSSQYPLSPGAQKGRNTNTGIGSIIPIRGSVPMRLTAAFILTLSVGIPSFAQRGPTGLHGVTGSVGSVVYPAGAPGTPGVIRTGSSVVNPGGGGVHLTVPPATTGVF